MFSFQTDKWDDFQLKCVFNWKTKTDRICFLISLDENWKLNWMKEIEWETEQPGGWVIEWGEKKKQKQLTTRIVVTFNNKTNENMKSIS